MGCGSSGIRYETRVSVLRLSPAGGVDGALSAVCALVVHDGAVARLSGLSMNVRLMHGDCIEVMATLPGASVDALVTDPPYGIGFMGREWDTFKPGSGATRKLMHPRERARAKIESDNPNIDGRHRSPALSPSQIDYDYSVTGLRRFQEWTELWAREAIRVLKPGGHAVVCGAPRAYHRMASGLEDAGFEIRDCLAWLFGSGFPKSLNLGEGLGTALKPAHEPIVLARKPFKGTVKGNVATHGTGALNIDACRIKFASEDDAAAAAAAAAAAQRAVHQKSGEGVYQMGFTNGPGSIGPYLEKMDLGRWPANVVINELAALVIDEQSGATDARVGQPRSAAAGDGWGMTFTGAEHNDKGGASRFYYCAKPSRSERDMGCYDIAQKSAGECTDRTDGSAGLRSPRAGAGRTGGGANFHPTVKPVDLMRWLVRLVTPVGGVVLDPFLGSGTTGMACQFEGRDFIGIEREADYIGIAERRIAECVPLFIGTSVAAEKVDAADDSQGSLFAETAS